MKLLKAAAIVTLFVSGAMLSASSRATTPLPPPTQLFEATDLNGNPVSSNFYLTGGGGLLRLDFAISGRVPFEWFGLERDWAGRQIDRGGYDLNLVGNGGPFCPFAEDAIPFPANAGGFIGGPTCWQLTPSLSGQLMAEVPAHLPSVFGAIAPLSISTPNGPLVFHDWEVVDPNPGQCRTGNMGVRAIPDSAEFRGLGPSFAEGVEQRLAVQNADGSIGGKFRAVYVPASPDVSLPLVTVDSPRDCMQIPRNTSVTVAFACRDLGSGTSSCAATQGPANGQTINTTQYGDFTLTIMATDIAGNARVRTVRYSVVDATPPSATPVVLTQATSYGWYNHPQIAWNWNDDLGGLGIDTAQCTQTSTVTVEGAAVVATATCRDLSGNVGTASVTLSVDNTPPGPAWDDDDRVVPNPVVQNQPALGLSPNWTDDLSGMASVDCVPVATAVAGPQNEACTGTDRAGNTRTRLIPYTVAAPMGEVLLWFAGSDSPTMNRINVDGSARSSFAVNQARSIAANVTNLFYVVSQPGTSDGPLVRTDLDGANAVVVHQGDMFLELSPSYIYIRNPVNLIKIYPDGRSAAPEYWFYTTLQLFTADDQFVYFPAGNQIVRANLDGSNQITIATLESSPRDMAQRGNVIYWTDGADGHIGRVKTDGTGFVEHLINVNASAVAVSSAYVFWSNAGATTIGRARLNGTAVQASFITGTGSNIGNMTIGGAPLPNHAPVALDTAVSTNEDTVLTGTLSGGDADDDGLTFSIVTGTTNGTVVITDPATGGFSYTPNPNVNGTDSFTFKVNDGTANSNVATVTVTVAPVNDAPLAVNSALTVREETPGVGAVQAVDPEGQTVQYRIVGNGTKGIALMHPATGAFVYVPLPNATGADQVRFVANDGALDSIPGIITITITPVNDAPVAQPLTVTTRVNTPVTQQLPATDVDGDVLTFVITSQPSKGTVTVTAAGLFTYTPKKSSNGNDSFTFKVIDPTGASSTATVTVNVIK